MKQVVFYIIALVLISCSSEEKIESPTVYQEPSYEVTYYPVGEKVVGDRDSTISFDRKTGFVRCDNKPYTGWLINHYHNGQLKSKVGYYNGIREDTSYGYHINGDLMYKRPYHEGKKHGKHIGWHEGGQKEYELYFYMGASEGTHYSWYKNGALQKEKHYQHGKQVGSQKTWYENGKIFTNYVVKENGRKYGLYSIKRCLRVDTEKENLR